MQFVRKLLNRPYFLAVCAGVTLSLGFPTVGVWPLIPAGLGLYFFNASHLRRSNSQVWWSGYITGIIVVFRLYYEGLSHVSRMAGAEGFSQLARLSPVPIALIFGLVFAVVAVAYRTLRTKSTVLNTLTGASIYMLGELLQQYVCQGYYWASLAHPFASFAPALAISSLGGTYLVSFCIAWVGCLCAEYMMHGRAALPAVAITTLSITGLWILSIALTPADLERGSLTVASVQVADSVVIFKSPGDFIQGEAQELFNIAGHSGADLVIYPQDITRGALYTGAPYMGLKRGEFVSTAFDAVGPWLSSMVASSSTVLVWPIVYDTPNDRFYETFQFFKNGTREAAYYKQLLFPFTDYFPAWMRSLGLVSRDDTLTPGPAVNYTQVGPWRIGTIDCSEINQPQLAQREAREADFLLSMGSDTEFHNNMSPQYSLSAARYTAAENHIPLLRVSLTGPSAIINPDGSLGVSLQQNESGILSGTIALYKNQPTLYNRFGSFPVVVVIICSIGAAMYTRRRTL